MNLSAADLEQRAERAVRRGELLQALELFDALLAQRPDDERVRQRMESVRALLQPSELVHRRRAEVAEADEAELARADQLSDAELGELHASSGRFAEAMSVYQRALARNPGNELIRERLEELQKLAPPPERADLKAAPRLEGGTPSRGTSRADPQQGRSARAADAGFRPLEDTPPAVATRPPPAASRPLPRDPIELLKALLDRIRGGRRR